MTREEAKEFYTILQAYAEGKVIEFWRNTEYRIKPKSVYRPFESAHECIEEMKKHEPFGWVKDKPEFGDTCSVITKVSNSYIRCEETWHNPKEMFQYNNFLDGSPFGIKVEDKEE